MLNSLHVLGLPPGDLVMLASCGAKENLLLLVHQLRVHFKHAGVAADGKGVDDIVWLLDARALPVHGSSIMKRFTGKSLHTEIGEKSL